VPIKSYLAHAVEGQRETMKIVLVGFMAGTALSGCALVKYANVWEAEYLLNKAGFTVQQADTPERLARLNSMPAHKVTPYTQDGQTVYVYADPLRCKCIYVGGPQEYARFQELVRIEQAKLEYYANQPMASEWR
jgi:hypothetical protein